MGIGNLVGVAGDEIVGVVDLSRRLQGLVHISRAVLVGEHPAQDRAITQSERRPFARHRQEVPGAPRIEDKRVQNRKPVPALRPDLAPHIAELQRVHPLDPGGSREHRHGVRDLARADAARDRAAQHGVDMRVRVIALPGVAIDAPPRIRRHDWVLGADMLEVVIVHVGFHPRALEMKGLVVLGARQRREEKEFEDVNRQLALDRVDVAGDRFRRVGGEAQDVAGPGHDLGAPPHLQHLAIFPDLVLALLGAHQGFGVDVLEPDENRIAAGPRRLLDEVRDLVAERVDLEKEPDPEAVLLPQFDQPIEDRLPVAVAGKIVIRDEEARNALRSIGAHDRLDVVRRPIARLAPLDIDDGAEAALERAATSGVETCVVARHSRHHLARQPRRRSGRHVRHVVEIVVDRLRLPRINVRQELCKSTFALPGIEDDPKRLRLFQVRRQFRQHGNTAGNVESSNGDRHALLAKLSRNVERARKLIRLDADQGDHAAIREDSLRDGRKINDGVAFVVDLELDLDVGAEHVVVRAFAQQSVDTGEAVRGDCRAPPLDDIAVVIVMRRLDQNDRELALGHSALMRGFAPSSFRRLKQVPPRRGPGNSKSAGWRAPPVRRMIQSSHSAREEAQMNTAVELSEAVGMNVQRLERIRPAMQAYVDRGVYAGINTLIARRGKVVHTGAFGWRDKEAGEAMTADTIFRLYSMTKPIICTALMTLLEEGRFRLIDPVAKYVPAFGSVKVLEADGSLVAPVRPILVRDLMTHMSGLSYHFVEEAGVGKMYTEAKLLAAPHSLEAAVDDLARFPLAFQPGTRWRYSVGIDVAARVIEVISGRPLGVFLRERLFGPLGMADTAFGVPPEKRSRLAAMYGRPEVGGGATMRSALEAWSKGVNDRLDLSN